MNPMSMGLDYMRQLGASQGQIESNVGQRQQQQMRDMQMQQQQAEIEEAERRQFFDTLSSVRQLATPEERIMALQQSPFAQSEDFEQFITPETMSDAGLDQILAASPYNQAEQDLTAPAGQREFEYLTGLIQNENTPPEVVKAARVKLGLTGRAGQPKIVSYGGLDYMQQGEMLYPITTSGGQTTFGEPTTVENLPKPQALSPEDAKRREMELEAEAAGLKTAAVEGSKAEATKEAGVASKLESANRSIETIDRILRSPALSSNPLTGAFGAGSVLPTIPGTPKANIQEFIETLQSQQFTNEISKLRGMGSLSDAEGKKVAAAAESLSLRMSPEEFTLSLNQIRDSLQKIIDSNEGVDSNTINWEDL